MNSTNSSGCSTMVCSALSVVRLLSKSFFAEGTGYTGEIVPLKETKLLAPVKPSKGLAIALNYASHGGSPTRDIGMFSKLPSSIIGPGETITPPPDSTGVHYEGEMVVVMGARARNISDGRNR